ncbi:hypothetical protein BD560DRAFT_431582 [Blakeslea trispora]|nr:hypothetical protein BD560DRAFT_431582 [Blakeslea trispora]
MLERIVDVFATTSSLGELNVLYDNLVLSNRHTPFVKLVKIYTDSQAVLFEAMKNTHSAVNWKHLRMLEVRDIYHSKPLCIEDEDTVYTGSSNGIIRIFHGAAGDHSENVVIENLGLSDDKQYLISSGYDDKLRSWNRNHLFHFCLQEVTYDSSRMKASGHVLPYLPWVPTLVGATDTKRKNVYSQNLCDAP